VPHYLIQASYKGDQIKALVANPRSREGEIRKLIESYGGSLIGVYFSFGSYDLAIIAEAPDSEAMAACSMAVAASGTTSKFETTVLLTMDEAVEAMKKAGALTGAYTPPAG
jgi:uncharacterized protein with GYD domain